jgi:hypothetical protein
MAAIRVPAKCFFCPGSFTPGDKIVYISMATVTKDRYQQVGEIRIRRHGGDAKKWAIHEKCWEEARLAMFNAAACEANMKKATTLVGVLLDEQAAQRSKTGRVERLRHGT